MNIFGYNILYNVIHCGLSKTQEAHQKQAEGYKLLIIISVQMRLQLPTQMAEPGFTCKIIFNPFDRGQNSESTTKRYKDTPPILLKTSFRPLTFSSKWP